MLQALPHILLSQGREAEARTPGLQGGDDLADIVADEAEAGVASILLDHCEHTAPSAGVQQAALDEHGSA